MLAGVVLLRMLVAASQHLFLIPEGSSLDDMLMVRGAMSIAEGDWLGDYSAIAIAKNMGYSLWLALWHKLGVNILLANAGLWLLACGLSAFALRPLAKGNFARLCVFAFLAFSPFSFAYFTMRAYRDAIFHSLCLLVFAGVMGAALRMPAAKTGGTLLCALGAGLGLAAAWLLREDGAVVLVFAALALLAVVLFAMFDKTTKKRGGKIAAALSPFAILAAAVLAFSGANAAHFGFFAVNDLTYGTFPKAYGAMAAVSQAESGYTRFVPVTKNALDKMFKEVPALEDLQDELQSGLVFQGYAKRDGSGEYGGSFYYALRVAAEIAGVTPNADTAQAYWQQVADEIEDAVSEGRLESIKPSATVTPKWNKTLFKPVMEETGRGFMAVMTMRNTNPRTEESLGDPEKIDAVAAFLNGPVQKGYVEGGGTPYYGPVRTAVYAFCDMLCWVYRIIIWPLFAFGLWQCALVLATGVKSLAKEKKLNMHLLYGIILLGLLLSFFLRLFVAAFMEQASFGIGTYEMYLSGGVPALLLFCAGGLLWRKNAFDEEPA